MPKYTYKNYTFIVVHIYLQMSQIKKSIRNVGAECHVASRSAVSQRRAQQQNDIIYAAQSHKWRMPSTRNECERGEKKLWHDGWVWATVRVNIGRTLNYSIILLHSGWLN